jgi:hypothetical protein
MKRAVVIIMALGALGASPVKAWPHHSSSGYHYHHSHGLRQCSDQDEDTDHYDRGFTIHQDDPDSPWGEVIDQDGNRVGDSYRWPNGDIEITPEQELSK